MKMSRHLLLLKNQVDELLKGLGFTQKKPDSQVRWVVLNTILLSRRHEQAHARLADAMSVGRSISFCIDVIEEAIKDVDVLVALSPAISQAIRVVPYLTPLAC